MWQARDGGNNSKAFEVAGRGPVVCRTGGFRISGAGRNGGLVAARIRHGKGVTFQKELTAQLDMPSREKRK